MRLILASGSKNRQQIMDMIGLKYEVIKSDKEEESSATDPKQYVIDLSKDKADVVASKIKLQNQTNQENSAEPVDAVNSANSVNSVVIIAADSIIYMDGKIYEKPKNKEEAFQNMKEMSGKVTYALTGVTIKDLYNKKEVSFSDVSEVYFKEMSDKDINWYVENDKHILERCGYSIEGKAAIFVDKVVGDYNNAIGLPIGKVYKELQNLGYSISDFELSEK